MIAPRPTPWWDRSRHEDRRPFLLARGRVQAALRAWFVEQGFIEVETSALQASPGNETHLHAFETQWTDGGGTSQSLYLHTSPEFACKKLLAAGEERIFTFAQCYRNREIGPLHEPAFTMLEWYRANEPYEALMADCTAIARVAADVCGRTAWQHRGHCADLARPPARISVADALTDTAGIDILATLGEGEPDRQRLARMAAGAGIRIASDDTWSDIFTRLLLERVEPMLASQDALAILDAYPAPEAALARPSDADPRVAERFEMFACGIELANGFGELTDATAQRTRFEADMAEKQRLYGECYPIDEEFLAALAEMPPASGCALGFDRLVMLAAGAERLDQVVWTPVSAALVTPTANE